MYIWDEDAYKELTDLKHNNTDIAPLLPHAKEYSFGTGDRITCHGINFM